MEFVGFNEITKDKVYLTVRHKPRKSLKFWKKQPTTWKVIQVYRSNEGWFHYSGTYLSLVFKVKLEKLFQEEIKQKLVKKIKKHRKNQ